MRGLLLAALLAAPAGAAAPPAEAVSALLAFAPPKGWALEEYANAEGADPVLSYAKGADAVLVRAFGAPGSDFPTAEEFLAGAEASEDGAAAVAGRKRTLYRRRFPLEAKDPHRPSKVKSPLGTEVFCVLPLRGKRFAVLSYRRESPAPGDGSGAKAWNAFLKTVRPR